MFQMIQRIKKPYVMMIITILKTKSMPKKSMLKLPNSHLKEKPASVLILNASNSIVCASLMVHSAHQLVNASPAATKAPTKLKSKTHEKIHSLATRMHSHRK